jgi:hypothetical protein
VNVTPELLDQTVEHPGGIIGVLRRVHGRGGTGKRVVAVVDLEEPVPVAAVPHHVPAGVGPGAAGLLGSDRSQERWVHVVALGRLGDGRGEGDPVGRELGTGGVDSHGPPLSLRPGLADMT